MTCLTRWIVAAVVLATVTGCGGSSSRNEEEGLAPSVEFADSVLAQCVSSSPMLKVGEGLDAPGLRLEVPVPPVGNAGGSCGNNNKYRFGSGLYDITGPVANTSGMGWEYPLQVFSGLHTRLHARAYAIESPCNGKRILFLSADIGLMWPALRKGVLAAIAADPELSKVYQPDNVMLSVTHTHQGPAGYSHDDGGNLFHWGYDDLNYQVIVKGMVEAIRLAHANIELHPSADAITLAVSELLNTNVNRSRQAFVLNSDTERNEFLNSRGEHIDVNKRFVQLNLVRHSGSAVGVINWFGVHPTILGPELDLVGSDHKGFASLGFEKIMRSRYDAPAGVDNFVAAFAQADEGDSSPNIRVLEKPWPNPERGGGKDPYESNAIAGTKQLAKSLELFAQGKALTGPVDYRLFNVPIDSITVTDPVVLASLQHPAELDAAEKRTCSGTLGVSFGAGAEDGRGPSQEGVSCKSSPDVIAAAAADFDVLLNEPIPPFNAWDADIPSNLASTAVFCNRSRFPQPGADYSCQAEKPVFLPLGPSVLPFQLFRVGNLAIMALPWEVTTMSARRLRKTLLEALAPAGVDTVIIAGLVNDYVNYLTTREEYSSQQYEGASTLYGPWTLAVVQQESRKLALSLRDGTAAPEGPATPAGARPGLLRPPYLISDLPGRGGSYGALIADVPATAAPGDTVRAEFQSGYPRNDLRIQSSYVYAERKSADGNWVAVAQDRDPELLFVWKPMIPSPIPIDPAVVGSSTAEVVWTIPRNTRPGTYRLRHVGASTPSPQQASVPYEGISGEFTVAGTPALCP